MTNYEHYKSEIDKITRMGRMVAVEEKTGKITFYFMFGMTEGHHIQQIQNQRGNMQN